MAARRIDKLIRQRKLEQAERDEASMNKQDKEASDRMEQIIVENHLFDDPQFNREGMVQATGLSPYKIVQLIQKFTGLSPSDYIIKLRLEHSVKLIKEHPDWTIDRMIERKMAKLGRLYCINIS